MEYGVSHKHAKHTPLSSMIVANGVPRPPPRSNLSSASVEKVRFQTKAVPTQKVRMLIASHELETQHATKWISRDQSQHG